MSFARILGVFASSRFFSSLILLLIGVATARLLGPEGRGYYALFFTVVGVAGNAANLGLSQANTYLLNREKLALGTLAGNSLLYVLALTVLFLIGLSIFYNVTGQAFAGVVGTKGWWLLGLAITATLLETCFTGLVLGKHLYVFQSKSLALQAVLLFFATVLIFPFGQNLEVALELRLAAMCLFVFWYMAAFWHQLSPILFKASTTVFKRQVHFGSRSWFQNLVGLLNYRGYIILLASMGTPEAVGVFSIALLLVEIVRFMPDTIAYLLMPKLAGMDVREDTSGIAAFTCRTVLFVVLLIALVLFLIANWLVPFVFGQEYQEGVVVSQFLLIGSVFGAVYQILSRYFTSEAKQVYSIYSALIALTSGLFISVLLIPELGAKGAAIAFAGSAFSCALSMLVLFRRCTGISIVNTLLATKSDWVTIWEYVNKRSKTDAN